MKNRELITLTFAFTLSLVSLLVSLPSAATDYPTRPLRLLVPYSAGGSNDVLARIIGDKLTKSLKQPVVIDNRPGAGGNLAVEVAAQSAPDGYTMVLPGSAVAINVSLSSTVRYKLSDLSAVSILAKSPLILTASPSFGANSVADVIRMAKEIPGKLNYSSGGIGGSTHLAAELFKLRAGVNIEHVPYKGTNDLLPDLLSGRVPLSFLPPSNARDLVRDGKLRALAVTSASRMPGLPDTPAIAETVPDYDVGTWFTIMVPKATPRAIVDKLSSAIADALQEPDVREKLLSLGTEPVGTTAIEADAFVAAEAARWERVIRAANIQVN